MCEKCIIVADEMRLLHITTVKNFLNTIYCILKFRTLLRAKFDTVKPQFNGLIGGKGCPFMLIVKSGWFCYKFIFRVTSVSYGQKIH